MKKLTSVERPLSASLRPNSRQHRTNSSMVRICFVAFVISITVAHGQQTPLEAAIKQGLENNRQLKISGYKVSLAEMKYREAVDMTLPSLKLSTGYTQLSDLDPPKIKFPGAAEPVVLFPIYTNNYLAKASLYETIFSGFRLKYAQQSQRLLEEAAKLDAVKDKNEVVFSIVAAYFNLYKIDQSIRIVDENSRQLQERNEEASQMEKEGVLLHNDVLRIQLQQSNTALAKLDLQNNRSVAEFGFNILIGADERSAVLIDSAIVKDVPALNTLEAYISDAVKNRGDMQSFQTRTQSLENNFKIVQNSYYPQIGVAANYYDSRPNARIIPPKDEFVTTWDAGISLTWDLTNLYSNRHQVADYRIQLQQAQEMSGQLQDAIRMEVNQNYVACTQAGEKLKVMQKTVEQAEENFRIMDLRYKNGMALTSDYLDADVLVVQSRINLMLAKADATLNYYKLMKSTGSIGNMVK